MSKGFASGFRIICIITVVLALFGLVAWKLVLLHVVDRNTYLADAIKARSNIVVEQARRGDITDARGDILATSRSIIELGFDAKELKPVDQAKWPELARLLNIPLLDLTKTFQADKSKRWVKLAESIEESTYVQIQNLKIKGVYGNRIYRRAYPHNQLAAHIVGYVNKENTPAAGVEQFADFYLRGQSGWRESEKDGRRHERAEFRTREISATSGYTVQLTIDTVIQHIVEEELARIVSELNPAKVSIIVSDPQTGYILALANHPTFDLNKFNTEPLDNQRNLAITDIIEPGSTFKIVAAAAALNEGRVTPDTRFDCSKLTIEYKGITRRFMQDDHPSHEPLTVTDIIAQSSNIGTPQLAMAVGDEKFFSYVKAFGFGQKTGFPFGGEIPGIVRSPEKWSAPDITRIPAGYSIGVTPMQIHCAMSAIANNGLLMRPQVIRQIRDSNNEIVAGFSPALHSTPVQPRTAGTLSKMLTQVVTQGTGKSAAIPGYEVAGKTGTAQKIIDGKYSPKHHVGSFVGFFPASRPRVVISIIVDDAKLKTGRLSYGSVVAAPSFKIIGQQLIPYLDIEPVSTPAPLPNNRQQQPTLARR